MRHTTPTLPTLKAGINAAQVRKTMREREAEFKRLRARVKELEAEVETLKMERSKVRCLLKGRTP